MALRGIWVAALMSAAAVMGNAGAVEAQFGGLGGLVKRAGISLPSLRKEPISTSLADARWSDPSRDGFVPSSPKRSLSELQRTPNGGFVLQAGYFSFHGQSYCLHAGTHGPGNGDGYLYAPPLGSARDAVIAIVRNSVQHPEIDQHTIQALLWAILSRAKIEDLSNDQKMAAAQLLTPRQLAGLNRNVLDMLGSGPIADHLPKEVRSAMQAEADLRRMLATPGTSYGELERVAVLAGIAPVGAGSIGVPTGRWSQHPDGYWIRYLPGSYTNTVVEIWVPSDASGIGKEYDPATHIAVPGNTARQRLIQSGRPYRS
ncbi:hypothetical protein ASE95_05830 [Sphingomonas sp. Leaf231]|uniref:hypothetical protein n=1 Tax=Sphingomonas sp. Leaf231 TaxID=1736301 RepID=UPI0006FDC7BE|nr:hypothetical protein [Sphingomonas sp. Leaf231]KQN94350.1 hypothetical protein ASE95_05830 [Sphingomonas sp. Leaf231]